MMQHLNRVTTSIEEGLDRAASRLREEKANFMTNHRAELASLYAEYDTHGQNGSLHELSPLWAINDTDTEEIKTTKKANATLACGLYGSNRPIINKHWEEVKMANGGRTLMCPICGIRECEDMDHYVSRSVMSEYSVHLTNLIPLCHRCNHKKGKLWLNEDGRRLIFNAYFDETPSQLSISCTIEQSPLDGMPQIQIQYSAPLATAEPIYHIIDSTINKLHLLDLYQHEVEISFRKELIRIEGELNIFNPELDRMDVWNRIKEMYHTMLDRDEYRTIIDIMVYTALVDSDVINDWVNQI